MKTNLSRKILLGIIFLLSFENLKAQDTKVTFRLKITELENPGTISLLGPAIPWGVYNISAKKEMQPPDSEGFLSISVVIPDSLTNRKLKYSFRSATNKTDIRREFMVQKSESKTITDLWGYLDGFGKMIKPFQEMLVRQTNTAEEVAYLASPYIGITTNGKKQENLFPIK